MQICKLFSFVEFALCRESLLITSWDKVDCLGRFSLNLLQLTDTTETTVPGYLLAIEREINQRTLVLDFYSFCIYNIQKEEIRMTNVEKKKVMLSLPVEVNTRLEELARENGLTKSALVTVLIQKLNQEGQIFK